LRPGFFEHIPGGEKITLKGGRLDVPLNPIIPFIEGDGIGWDVWQAARPVLDESVQLAYSAARQLCWMELPAGDKALKQYDTLLPSETIDAFSEHLVGIKGPLTTPVGKGFRSLNVALRRALDLYVCVRPVRWIPGVPCPVNNPQNVDMVVFRENTEDIYAGIEFECGSESNMQFQTWLREHYPEEFAKIRFPASSGIGIKPISRQGSERLVRAAIRYAQKNNRGGITLIHKGNIMKYTEGAFTEWGYALAEREFGDRVYTYRQWLESKKRGGLEVANQHRSEAIQAGKIWINDSITDAAFERTLTRPDEFDILATMNLNGDLFSDALSAQVGGLGIAPGANLNDESQVAIFEATHGTAPLIAGQNKANPCSLILSGQMMLHHLGWHAAAELIQESIQKTIDSKTVTFDFLCQMPEARLVSTVEFGEAVIKHMRAVAQ